MEWLARLRDFKSTAGLSVREISEQSGIPVPTLESLFASQTKNPGVRTLLPVVHTLGHTLDDLVEDDPAYGTLSTSNTKEMTLLSSFRELNEEGQETALNVVQSLAASGQFKKNQ